MYDVHAVAKLGLFRTASKKIYHQMYDVHAVAKSGLLTLSPPFGRLDLARSIVAKWLDWQQESFLLQGWILFLTCL